MPTQVTPKLMSWASDIDPETLEQAQKAARLPIVEGHVALMPDAHIGIGATIGSVIPTKNAIIPAAVGVDIGCGMIAAELNVSAADLPDAIEPLLHPISRSIPAGVGRGHDGKRRRARNTNPSYGRAAGELWLSQNPAPSELSDKQLETAADQFGTLGSGNHFFEVCLDERDRVWVMLHSGSRGIGNQLAQVHIESARSLAKALELRLEDPDLAYFTEGTHEFQAYVSDMLWAQRYAFANRAQMMDAAIRDVVRFIGTGEELRRINCHHNFAQREMHGGQELWITRKGAIQAGDGDLGLIPGSMGASSYVVRGRGNADSWRSCSHGAGRRLSRTAARRQFTADDLATAMGDRAWQADKARQLVDEIPAAYKNIEQVMADQYDLVEVVHSLRQILNYKGT